MDNPLDDSDVLGKIHFKLVSVCITPSPIHIHIHYIDSLAQVTSANVVITESSKLKLDSIVYNFAVAYVKYIIRRPLEEVPSLHLKLSMGLDLYRNWLSSTFVKLPPAKFTEK